MSFWSICGDLSNVVATGLAALSIGLTLADRRKERKHERNRNIVEQKLHWYNEVVLKDIIKSLNEFVDGATRQLEHCKEHSDKNTIESDLKEIYSSINDRYKSVGERISFLRTFSMLLYRECDDKLQGIFDMYSDIINEAIQRKHIFYINIYEIQRNKQAIFAALYKWANDFVESEE